MLNTSFSIKNKLIASVKSNWYLHTEQIKLAYQRHKYEKFYGPDEPEPHIFIYTPTFNRGEILIERAVQSVLNQTYKNFTYLVVGDCCTDNTEELLKKVSDPRLQFYNIPKRGYRYPPTVENHWFAGPVVAANTALSRIDEGCTWIARLDDDEIWKADHLESVLAYALEGNYELVTSGYLTIRDGVEKIVKGDYLYGDYFKEPLPTTDRYMYNPMIGSISTVFYRDYLRMFKFNLDCWRKKHNRVNDIDFFHRMGIAGVRMGFLDKVTCISLPRPGETTIGLDAYRKDADNKLQHFAFE